MSWYGCPAASTEKPPFSTALLVMSPTLPPTVLFRGLIIHLAHQPPVLHEVKLVPGGQLSAAHDAGEAVQLKYRELRRRRKREKRKRRRGAHSKHTLRRTNKTLTQERLYITQPTHRNKKSTMTHPNHYWDPYTTEYIEYKPVVDASGSGETFVRQRSLAVGALEALGVPVSVQHLQDELVQDVLTTAGAVRDLCGGTGGHMHRRALRAVPPKPLSPLGVYSRDGVRAVPSRAELFWSESDRLRGPCSAAGAAGCDVTAAEAHGGPMGAQEEEAPRAESILHRCTSEEEKGEEEEEERRGV
ncbi:hypothetical protein EYF80_000554 [Liparis tanakae]|uniref:Uncharacterized protein n=1 Tax=Liparis tanakae TaxID=230148 RepID=A0A4Z2JG84_9TELE|nr:hypothetical protein EYF80_000554 [Liparis tanakae]